MRHRAPRGVAAYIEAFTLIGIAVGGSAIVYSSMAGYAGSAGGASVGVSGVSLIQGPYFALEKLTIANTGSSAFGSFTVSTSISASPSYCVTLAEDTASVGFSSPPAPCGSGTTADPSSIPISLAAPLAPGCAVVVSAVIYSGREFAVGGQYVVTVTTSAGAGQMAPAVAAPA